MQCYEANVLCSRDHINDSSRDYSPYSRSTSNKMYGDHHLRRSAPCYSCCNPEAQTCSGRDYPFEHTADSQRRYAKEDDHLHRVSHSCPLGNVVCYTDGTKNNCRVGKAKDINCTQEGTIYFPCSQKGVKSDDAVKIKELTSCPKRASWTEPRTCGCGPCGATGGLEYYQCEPGAAVFPQPSPEKKSKQRVHFAEERQDHCIGKPVLIAEMTEYEGNREPHEDFCWQKSPQKAFSQCHPNVNDRWHPGVQEPFLPETTYQHGYRHPCVTYAYGGRNPVYLPPPREKITDARQDAAEEHFAWKKTSTGDSHVYHDSCETCDEDLKRVHVHDCDAAHLPPQYQCHGDGHLCQPSQHTTGDKFTLCEVGDRGKSKYWWKRACCSPLPKDVAKACNLPPEFNKPACPSYMTTYNHDFRNPKRQENEKLYLENCYASEYCRRAPRQEQPNLLCTKHTGQPVMTIRAGVI